MAEFKKNAAATTVSSGLSLLKWIFWILAGIAGGLCVYLSITTGESDPAQILPITLGVLAILLYLGGKGIAAYHQSIIKK